MVEFRPTDGEAAQRILRYAFAPERGPVTDEAPERSTLFDQRGLYDGELVSVCKLYHLEARFRGRLEPLGGLGAVATPPEHRREGYARDLCRGALEEFYENGTPLVALWPFSTPFYRRLGWGTANKYTRYDLSPDALPGHDAQGQMCQLTPDDWERLRPVETAFGEGTTLSLRRSEQWWHERTLADWDGGGVPYIYGYERDGGLEGYVLFTIEDATLTVDDLAHTDDEAYRALLSFLGTHGAQREQVVLRRASESELLDRVADPAAVECRIEPGPMVRLTAVDALETLDWPELSLTLAVSDPLLDRNDGQFRLSGADGVESVETDDCDLSVDIATLSQLFVGTYDLAGAEQFGTLELREEALREPLSGVFQPQPVCLREFF